MSQTATLHRKNMDIRTLCVKLAIEGTIGASCVARMEKALAKVGLLSRYCTSQAGRSVGPKLALFSAVT